MILLIWVILIFGAIFLIRKLNFHPIDRKLHLFIGKKGCGKSSHIAKMVTWCNLHNVTAYTIGISVPGAIMLHRDDLGKVALLPDSILFIDEIGMIFDNRKFKTFSDEARDFFKLQRHYKLTVYCYSQSRDCDKKIRDMMDYLYIARRSGSLGVYKRVNKSISIGTDQDGNGSIVESYQYSGLLDMIFFNGISFTYLPKYYDMFDSFITDSLASIDLQPEPYSEHQQSIKTTRGYIKSRLIELINRYKTDVNSKKQFITFRFDRKDKYNDDN